MATSQTTRACTADGIPDVGHTQMHTYRERERERGAKLRPRAGNSALNGRRFRWKRTKEEEKEGKIRGGGEGGLGRR